MTECWCGCGRELKRSEARIAKRGREAYALTTILEDDYKPIIEAIEEKGIAERTEADDPAIAAAAERYGVRPDIIRDLYTPDERSHTLSDLEDFIADGEKLTEELLLVAHGELPAQAVDRRLMNGWGKIAVSLLRQGLPPAYFSQEFRHRRATITLRASGDGR
jgi:hypothetical protein